MSLFGKEFASFVESCKIRTVAMDHVLNLSTRTGFLERHCPRRAIDASPPCPLGYSVFTRLGNPGDDQANSEKSKTVATARDELGSDIVLGYSQGDLDSMTSPKLSPNIEIKSKRIGNLATSSERDTPKRQGITSVVAEPAPIQSSGSCERDEMKKEEDRKPCSRIRHGDARSGEQEGRDRISSGSTASSGTSPLSSPSISSSDSCTVTSSTLPEDAGKNTSKNGSEIEPSAEKGTSQAIRRRITDGNRMREVRDGATRPSEGDLRQEMRENRKRRHSEERRWREVREDRERRRREIREDWERRRSEEDRQWEMRDGERRRHLKRSPPPRRSPPPPRRPSQRSRCSPPPPTRESRRISTDKQEKVFGISSRLRYEMLHAKEILKSKKESGKSDLCHKVQDCTVSGTDDGMQDKHPSASEQESCQGGHKSPTTDASRPAEKQSDIRSRDEHPQKTKSATAFEFGNRISKTRRGSFDCASKNKSKSEETASVSKSTRTSTEVGTTAQENVAEGTAKEPVCMDMSTQQIETESGSPLCCSTNVNKTVSVTTRATGQESRSHPAVQRGHVFVAVTQRSFSSEPASDAEEQRYSLAGVGRDLSLEPISDNEELVRSAAEPSGALSLEPISDAELQLHSAAKPRRALSLEPISDAEEQRNSVIYSPRALSLETVSDAETWDLKTSGNSNKDTSDDEADLLEDNDCVDHAEAHFEGSAARTRVYERVKDVPELQEARSSVTEQELVSAPNCAETNTTILRSKSSDKEKEHVSFPSPTPSHDLSQSCRDDTSVKESKVDEIGTSKVHALGCTDSEHSSSSDKTSTQLSNDSVLTTESCIKDVRQACEKGTTPTSNVELPPVFPPKVSGDAPLADPTMVPNERAVDSGTKKDSNIGSSLPTLPKSNSSCTKSSTDFYSRPGSSESERVDFPRNEQIGNGTVIESAHVAPLSVSTSALYPSSSLLNDSLFDAFRGNYITQAAPELHSVYGHYGSEMTTFRYGGYPVSPQPRSPAPQVLRSPVSQTASLFSTPGMPSSLTSSCVEPSSHRPSVSPPQQLRSPIPQSVSPSSSIQADGMHFSPQNSCVEPETSSANIHHPVTSETQIADSESLSPKLSEPEPTSECPTESVAKESSKKKQSRNIFERLGEFTASNSPSEQIHVKMEAVQESTPLIVHTGETERLSTQGLVHTSNSSQPKETLLSVGQAEPEPTNKLPRSTSLGISSERNASAGFLVSRNTLPMSVQNLREPERQPLQNIDVEVNGDEKEFKEKVMNSNGCDECFEHMSRQSVATYISLIFGHDMQSRYYCFDCPFNTFDATNFSTHLHSQHSEQTLLQCVFCAKPFSSIQELLIHQTWKQVPRKMCKHCGFCTTSRAVLMKHQATAHPNSPKRILGQNVRIPACVDHTCLVLHRCWQRKIGTLLSCKPTEPRRKQHLNLRDSVDSRKFVENFASVVQNLPLALKRRRSSEDLETPQKRPKGLSKRCSQCDELMASPRAAKSHICRSSSLSSVPEDHPLLSQPSPEESTTPPNESQTNNVTSVSRFLFKKQFSEPIIPVGTVANRKRRCVRCKELMESPKIAKKHVCATVTKTESVSSVRQCSDIMASLSNSEIASAVDYSPVDTTASVTPVKSEVHEDAPLSGSVEVINLISDDEEEPLPESQETTEPSGNAESNLEGCILVNSGEALMCRLGEKRAHSRKVVATPEALDLPSGEVYQHPTECPGCVVIFWNKKDLLQHLRTVHNVHCCGSI